MRSARMLATMMAAMVVSGGRIAAAEEEFPPFWTVALTGDPAPGFPSNVTIASFYPGNQSFYPPIAGPAGDVAFAGALTVNGSTVTTSNNVVLWCGKPGALRPVARKGELAPGYPGPGSGMYNGFPSASLNTNGDLAFTAYVSSTGTFYAVGTWATDADGHAAFLAAGPCVRLLDSGQTLVNGQAAEGRGILLRTPTAGTAPGSPGSTTLRWNFDAPQPGIGAGAALVEAYFVYANRLGHLFINGRLNTTPNVNDRAIWSEQGGTAHLVARLGSSAPDTTATFAYSGWLRQLCVNDNLQCAFQSYLNPVGTSSDMGVWSTRTGSLQLVAREGAQAPGQTSGTLIGDAVAGYGSVNLSQNAGGEVGFNTMLTGVGVVVGQNDYGIWSDTDGAFHSVARGGQPVPERLSNEVYWAMGSLTMGDDGRNAFDASFVPYLGATTPVRSVLIAEDRSGVQHVVARAGALHLVGGGVSNTLRSSFSISGWLPDGRLLYTAGFTNGVTGIYAVDVGSDAPPTTILHTGAQLTLQDGRVKQVTSLGGGARVIARGRLLMNLGFADGTSGYFVAGTNPTSGQPELRFTSISARGSNIVVEWQSASNAVYRLERSTNLMEWISNWAVGGIAPTPPVNVHTDTAPSAAGAFYRVRMEP